MNSGPSHAKEYKVGVYPQYRMPRKGRTKPAAGRQAGADRPRAAAAAQGLARRRGGVRPRCGSRARPPRAPPVRAARPPDTSVSTDHAASWTAYDSALASVGPGFRGQGAQSPDSPPRPSRGASTHSAGQRHRAAAGCRLAGHVTRGRDEDPKFAPKARQPSLRHARRMCRRKATGAAVVQRTLTELAAIVSAL